MKRRIIFGLLVAALLALPLVGACSEPAAPAQPAAPAPAPAPAPSPEVIKLKYASGMPEAGAPSQFATHFMDLVEERSGGRVEFERFHGGVLGKIFEMLNLVSAGACDITLLVHPMFKEQLPLHNFPEYQLSDTKAMEYVNKLNFDIPETAALLEKEDEANNIKGLNWHFLGEGGLLAKKEFSTVADLKGEKLGTQKEQKAYEELGLTVVSISDADLYESLSRGVCSVIAFPIDAAVHSKYYEVTKCFMYDGLFHGGQQTVVNLGVWNSLPADIQKIFLTTADDTEAFSVEFINSHAAEYEQIMKDNGVTLGSLPASETEMLLKLEYDMDVKDMIALGEQVGKAEEVKTVLKYADEITWGK